jgi:hypothetical protein
MLPQATAKMAFGHKENAELCNFKTCATGCDIQNPTCERLPERLSDGVAGPRKLPMELQRRIERQAAFGRVPMDLSSDLEAVPQVANIDMAVALPVRYR